MNAGNYSENRTDSHCSALLNSAFRIIELHRNKRKASAADGVNIEELLCKSNLGFSSFWRHITETFQVWSDSGTIPCESQMLQQLDEVYHMLGDVESKETFDWYLQFLIAIILTNSLAETENRFPYRVKNRQPDLEDLAGKLIQPQNGLMNVAGYLFEMCPGEAFFGTWICGNYFLENRCEPRPNDIVIDAGAFIGDTSIWFADRIGRDGKVYSFEILPSHVGLIQKNIEKNHLQDIVRVFETGLWDSNAPIFATQAGYDSKCSEEEGDIRINAVTLDSFVQQENVTKVDFIKMDIEGAELSALRGGAATVKKFKPRMAISIYHSPYDIMAIPVFIKSLVPEYKLYLSHKCPYPTDIILFAAI